MQIENESHTQDEQQFAAFKRMRRAEEARANVQRIECDCLSPVVDRAELKDMCRSANTLKMGAIVVYPAFVKMCVAHLGDDPKVALIAAVSYPYGGERTEVKAQAVKRAVKDGVDEVEVSAPVSFVKDGNWAYFKRECKKLKKAAKGRALRVVLECSALTEKETLRAAVTAADAGVNCLRLNGADGELITKVKTALKGKCLIKGDGAGSFAAFANLCVMGADTVSCTYACDLARYLLKQAEAEA